MLTTPNCSSLGSWFDQEPGHLIGFTVPIIKRALKRTGYRILKIDTAPISLLYPRRLFRHLNSLLTKLFKGTILQLWGDTILIKAYKLPISHAAHEFFSHDNDLLAKNYRIR